MQKMYKNMIKDKRGKVNTFLWILLVFVILASVLYIFDVNFNIFSSTSSATFTPTLKTPQEILNGKFMGSTGAGARLITFFGTILQFILGNVPTGYSALQGGDLGSLIVVLCVFGMMLLGFGDIFRNLSFFSEGISWGIAALLSVAVANIGFLADWLIWATRVMGIIGVTSLYLGLIFSFVAFMIVEFGITPLAPWLLKRKTMQAVSKYNVHTKAGGEMTAETITALGSISNALEGLGKKATK